MSKKKENIILINGNDKKGKTIMYKLTIIKSRKKINKPTQIIRQRNRKRYTSRLCKLGIEWNRGELVKSFVLVDCDEDDHWG